MSRHRRPMRTRTVGWILLGLLTAAALTVPFVMPGAALATTQHRFTLGAAGDRDQLSASAGVPLALHKYGRLEGQPVTDARFVNIEPSTTWADIAAGVADNDIARWASELRGHRRVLVSFSHEPATEPELGSASDFIAAWRHVVGVFRTMGDSNVEWVWNVTATSWTDPASPKYAPLWWPGNRWVDYVSSESYNYTGCRNREWTSFGAPLAAPLAFARDYGRPLVVGEFGSNGDTGRGRWLRHATRWLVRHPLTVAAFYYQNPHPPHAGCDFLLTGRRELDALHDMRTDLS